jgi:hypothetical protein
LLREQGVTELKSHHKVAVAQSQPQRPGGLTQLTIGHALEVKAGLC